MKEILETISGQLEQSVQNNRPLLKEGTLRLNKSGREAAKNIFERGLKVSGNNLDSLRLTVKMLSEEFGPTTPEAKVIKPILNSVTHQIIYQRQKSERERLKTKIKERDLDRVKKELEQSGKKVPNLAFLKNIVLSKRLREERFKKLKRRERKEKLKKFFRKTAVGMTAISLLGFLSDKFSHHADISLLADIPAQEEKKPTVIYDFNDRLKMRGLEIQTELKSVLETTTTRYSEEALGKRGVRKLKITSLEELKKLAKEGFYFKNNHPIVIVESEYLWFWAKQSATIRARLLEVYADSMIEGLMKVYSPDSTLIVGLEAGHMSVVPPDQTNEDTGTEAKLKEGGKITEREVNLMLSKMIAQKIVKKYPQWIPILNSDETGIPVEKSGYVGYYYLGDEKYFDVTTLDVAVRMRGPWEKLGQVNNNDSEDAQFVKLAIHFDGDHEQLRGGKTIPQATGLYRNQSYKIASAIASSLKENVEIIIPSYSSSVWDHDDPIHPYPITDAALFENHQKIFQGKVSEVKGLANKYLAMINRTGRRGI